ncbi:MAG: sensor histidine kinase [Marmoricola sp.]
MPVTAEAIRRCGPRGTLQRHAAVLVWLPGILVGPLLDLPDGVGGVLGGVGLVLLMAAGAVLAVIGSTPRPGARERVALAVLAAAVVAGSGFGSGWLPTWILLAITTPAVLRGWWLWGSLGLEVVGAMLAAWVSGTDTDGLGMEAFSVAVAGVATASFLRLMETVEELRRTREELARAAVAEERERFSRDLHDLLGHTLSVMVVKAEAVRRLAHRDPDAVAAHAADIETVGRRALLEVREAVDAMHAPSLADELDGARRALQAAGIATTVTGSGAEIPAATGQALAWAVREGTTNVLRHSGAAHCRIELADGTGELTLTVADDGTGGPATPQPGRQGGLDGLRRRLVAAGGRLEAHPDADGFRLVAVIPEPHRANPR